MPLIDITNPDIIKFLIENYDKTARLRMKWNHIHGEKMKEAASLTREEKGYYETDVLKQTMVAGMAIITRDNTVASSNRKLRVIRDGTHIPGITNLKKKHCITDVGFADPKIDPRLARPDTDLSVDPIMRPIDPKQKKVIYKDIPVFGRNAYLKSRSRIPPEQKYYFIECSGWEYGWRLTDSYFNKNAPTCGRVWRLTRDVKSRTGPHPDPKHYQNSDLLGVAKCPKV
ncbi:uncharacterized protein LOC113510758 [Galleria mellonella]|uniref:Uncharacterized protein LOC113510758 n=1 Tax=Galleria mellonella TaxID=7137 RepID=A0A6J1WI20_GALME|nr:uncharacterized protein LOC113510758 [Galleria mellonella]